MKHCIRCVMPDTRPGIQFDDRGVCYPCLAAERRRYGTDWEARREEWDALCDQHRHRHRLDPYDCVLPCSGGKDSHVQLARLKEAGMRPLVVTVGDWFGHTKAGEHNFANMCGMGADSLVYRQDPGLMRDMVRSAFVSAGCPTWPIDAAIYSVPLRVAAMIGVELVVYGEDIAYTYGGPGATEQPSAKRQHHNDVVKPFNDAWWHERGISLPEWLKMPAQSVIDKLEPVYQSYFFRWSGWDNKEDALRLGFRTADGEWDRQGCVENYDQIDSLGYLVHPWLKYPKLGHQRVTDVCSNWVREGRMARDQAVDLVLAHDHELDPRALDDFCAFTDISTRQFWAVVKPLYNRDLFERSGNWYTLCHPVYKLGYTDKDLESQGL